LRPPQNKLGQSDSTGPGNGTHHELELPANVSCGLVRQFLQKIFNEFLLHRDSEKLQFHEVLRIEVVSGMGIVA
jgi:hypothetical protein